MSTSPGPHAPAPKLPERRATPERRTGERRQLVLIPAEERRAAGTRRRPGDRRAGQDTPSESAAEHVRNALQLLMTIVDSGELDDEVRRDLDAAIFRLHFAIERLRRIDP